MRADIPVLVQVTQSGGIRSPRLHVKASAHRMPPNAKRRVTQLLAFPKSQARSIIAHSFNKVGTGRIYEHNFPNTLGLTLDCPFITTSDSRINLTLPTLSC